MSGLRRSRGCSGRRGRTGRSCDHPGRDGPSCCPAVLHISEAMQAGTVNQSTRVVLGLVFSRSLAFGVPLCSRHPRACCFSVAQNHPSSRALQPGAGSPAQTCQGSDVPANDFAQAAAPTLFICNRTALWLLMGANQIWDVQKISSLENHQEFTHCWWSGGTQGNGIAARNR